MEVSRINQYYINLGQLVKVQINVCVPFRRRNAAAASWDIESSDNENPSFSSLSQLQIDWV